MNMVNGTSLAPHFLSNASAAQLANDNERDGRLDGVFASLLSFGSTTSTKLHTQTMVDAEQMFQAKEADGAAEHGSSLQEGLGKEQEQSHTLTELDDADEPWVEADAGQSKGMIESAGAPPASKNFLPTANVRSANASIPVGTESLLGPSRGGIASPTEEVYGGSVLLNKAAELAPSVPSPTSLPSSNAGLGQSPALQVAEILKGSGSSGADRSSSTLAVANYAHPSRSQSKGLPKSNGPQPQIRNGEASAQRPSEVESPRFEELVRSLRLQMGAKQSSARLRLQPPELGHLRVDVKVLGDRVRIDVQTETDAARDLLSRRANQLKTGLENQGIRLERLEVVLNNSVVNTGVGSSAGLREFTPAMPARLTEVQRPRDTRRDENRSFARQRMSRSETLATVDSRLDING